MWLRDHTGLTLSCLYVVLVGVVAILALRHSAALSSTTSSSASSHRHRRMLDKQTIYALGGLLWPFVWAGVCGASVESLPPVAYLGLVWPSLLLLVDVAFVRHSYGEDASRTTFSLQNDGNVLSGMALAIGGLFVRYVSDGFARVASPMFIASILLILLVVTPSPSAHADSLQANAIHATQKVALQYCLGLIITSVGITFGVGMVKAGGQAHELQKAMGA